MKPFTRFLCHYGMSMKSTVRAAALILGLFCFGFIGTEALAKSRYEAAFHQTFPLAATGQVELDNINGKVHVTAWDRAEVEINALKRADSQEALDGLKIEIDAKPDRIRVHTQYPSTHRGWFGRRTKGDSGSVDYEVKVPSQACLQNIQTVNGNLELEGVRGTIHASTVNGKLLVRNVAADARLETVNGAVEAQLDTLTGVNSVSAHTVNGKVELTLPVNADAEVAANTVNGGIRTDPGLPVKKNWPVGSEVRATLGKGGAKIDAQTVNGAIRIHNPSGPQPVQLERAD